MLLNLRDFQCTAALSLYMNFVIFSSPEPKAQIKWALLIKICPLSVVVVVVVVVVDVNFSHFHFLLQNHWANFNQYTKHPWEKGIQVCSNEGHRPFPRGDNYEIVKIHWWNLKIFFSRTTGPISTKLGIKHPRVKGIQVCSNEGPALFQGEIITK